MKPRRLLNDSGLFGMIIALLGLAQPAQATLRAWSGAVSFDNTWTNAGNWSGNVAPVAGDDLEFPDSALHPNNTDNFAAGTTFNSITFFHGGSGGMSHGYDISGNAIALNAGISVVNNSVSSWPITLNNALMLNSNQTFATGPFTSLSLLGPINLNGNDLTF